MAQMQYNKEDKSKENLYWKERKEGKLTIRLDRSPARPCYRPMPLANQHRGNFVGFAGNPDQYKQKEGGVYMQRKTMLLTNLYMTIKNLMLSGLLPYRSTYFSRFLWRWEILTPSHGVDSWIRQVRTNSRSPW